MPTVTDWWHSIHKHVSHNYPRCRGGGEIKTKNKQAGRGGKRLCTSCQRFNKRSG